MIDFADMGPLAAPLTPTDDVARAFWDLNDSGNAQRFVSRHQGRFLFVRAQGWYCYDGKAWVKDGAEARALLAAEQTARAIKDEYKALFDAAERYAQKLEDEKATRFKERAVALMVWAETSGNVARIKAMLSLAAAKLEIPLEAFDAEPLALNCQNGTLRFFRDDKTQRWEVRLDPHDPNDKISRICAFEFHPKAEHKLWDAHLARSFPDQRERRFLMRVIGYCATGLMTEQVFFIWQGRGGDGKSVTANTIRRVLGTYAAKVDVKTFLEDKTGRSAAQASPDIARLSGATRFIVAEPPKGARLNEALMKDWTGGAPMVARYLNKELFEFLPCGHVTIDCNPLPGIAGADDGIWRRIVLVPWREQMKREDMDPAMEDKLVGEGEGVLAAIVAGVLNYFDRGLDQPDSIRAASADYKAGSNTFRDWLDQFCVFEPDHEIAQAVLYDTYKVEQERQGQEKIMSKISFGRALADMQIMKFRKPGSGDIMRRGLRLASEAERDARALAAPSATFTSLHKPSQSRTEGERPTGDADADAEAFRHEGD
jgi:putative DNA primase/helicase